jgi:hypothetical protein
MKFKLAFRILVVLVLVGSAAPISQNQESNRRDGNWWREIDAAGKANYIVGFFDGMELGNRFSFWGVVKDNKAEKTVKDAVTSSVVASYSDYSDKYLSHVTNVQLVDGLDAFYSDFKNRRIVIYGAVWLVLNEIAGKPEPEMQQLIENWRKNADKY